MTSCRFTAVYAAPVAVAAAALSLFCLCPTANAQVTFDTTPSWNGFSAVSPFGNPNTATYGETFVAPSSPVLDDFTFLIDAANGITLSEKAYVYAWSGPLQGHGGQATGSALYGSPTSTVINGTGSYQAVTTTTGGVTLTPGDDYVMFLTVSNPSDYAATNGTSSWGLDTFQHPANDGGGGLVFYNNGNNFGALNSSTWDTFSDFGDLAFTAHFSPIIQPQAVPEPGVLGLLGGLLVTGGSVLLRRRRATVAVA